MRIFYSFFLRLLTIFFLTAIQDLKRLDNGLLLSCAYDGKVICWHYNEDVKFGEFVKENQQLRCMDAVTESGTLLIGTNSLAILTQSITDWVNFSSFGDDGVLQQTGMRAIDFEEIKEDMDSNYASNMYDRSDYDVLEG